MKKIAGQNWKKNYYEEPSKNQKAWVQRWFELLDNNSSIVISLPQVSLKKLLNEFIETDVKETRTLFFILSEIYEKLNNRILFSDFYYNQNVDFFVAELMNLYSISQTLYKTEGISITKANWKSESESFKNSVKKFKEHFEPFILHHILSDEIFLDFHVRKLIKSLAEEASPFEDIDFLTQEILVYLVEKGIYSNSYLKNKCKQYFLEKNSSTFIDRIEKFSTELFGVPNHYVVYFQIQKNIDLINISSFRQVEVLSDLQSEINEIKELTNSNIIPHNMARELNYFLYFGEYPKDKTIIKVQILEAIDEETALKLADECVFKFLNVVKFEYSARNICVANKVLVRNINTHKIVTLNRKTIFCGKIHNVGNPKKLKRIAGQVASENLFEIKEIALYWYKQAIESESPETQFLNYWISLEQIFRQSTIDKSSGDKLVETIGKKIKENSRILEELNLWGDIYRVGVFNPNRVQSDIKGRVLFDNRIINNPRHVNKILIDDLNLNTGFIFIETTKTDKKKIRIHPNSIVFIEEGEMINKKQWLSGRYLTSTISDKYFIRAAFKGTIPLLTNIFYLQYYSYFVQNEFIQKEKCLEIGRHLSSFEELFTAIKWFEESEFKIDLLNKSELIAPQFKKYFEEYKNLFEIRKELILNLETIPDDFVLEAFRGEIKVEMPEDLLRDTLIHSDQPLLELRFNQFSKQNAVHKNQNFYPTLDRLRRTRNRLVHQAKSDTNIKLLSEYLAKERKKNKVLI